MHLACCSQVVSQKEPIITLGVVFTQLYNPSNIFACTRLVSVNFMTEYAPWHQLKWGNTAEWYFPNFENCAYYKKYLKDSKCDSPHLVWKYAWIFDIKCNLFPKAHSFPTAMLSENLLLRTDNVADKYPSIFSFISFFFINFYFTLTT